MRNEGRPGMFLSASVFCGLLVSLSASAGDWPAYKADAARSSVSGEELKLPLRRIWTYEPPQGPRPAWPEPGKELHRIDFDYAFQPVAAGGTVYFGSSADDTVRAVDAATGELKWRFTTGGPVRFAPAVLAGKCYVASDDGFVYCLDAARGKVVWRFRGGPRDDRMIGNERMISRWPIRTGVLVDAGAVYFAAGMWPAGGIYVYALDAKTGEIVWCNDSSGNMYIDLPHPGASAFTGVAPQGYMLATRDVLLVPTGRSVPAAYDRRTGRLLHYLPAASKHEGGCWSTVADDLYFSQAYPRGPDIDIHVGEADPKPGDGMAAYEIVTGKKVFNLVGKHRVLACGDTLYAVGNGEVLAFDLNRLRRKKPKKPVKPKEPKQPGKDEKPKKAEQPKKPTKKPQATDEPPEKKKLKHPAARWEAEHGRGYCLALAGKTLLVGGREGVSAFHAERGEALWSVKVGAQVRGLAVSDGRVFAATNTGAIVCFARQGVPLKPNRIRELLSWQRAVPAGRAQLPPEVLLPLRESRGYALVIAPDDSATAMRLAWQTNLHVVQVVKPAAKADAERKRLLTTDLYGSRIAVHGLDSLAALPFARYFADLVVVCGKAGDLSGGESVRLRFKELYRVLRPCGGMMCFAGTAPSAAEALLKDAGVPPGEIQRAGGSLLVVRGKLPGAGEWRHQWADAGRTGIGDDSRVRTPLELLWFGGPGPDRMMSRHWGTSTPLSVNGRVFVTGQHHVIAFNAYNGCELWARDLRDVGRFGAIWSSANFVADDHSVYATAGVNCYRFDQATGRVRAVYAAPEGLAAAPPVEEPPKPTPKLLAVKWPTTWQVVGPLPKRADLPNVPKMKTIPKEVTYKGRKYVPRPLETIQGVLDFSCLYGGYGLEPLKPAEKPEAFPRAKHKRDTDSERKVAYALAKIRCAAAGKLIIAASADWWMDWYLDGKRIYDTRRRGNRVEPTDLSYHVFLADASAGEHLVVVRVEAGSMGWSLASGGGAKYEPLLKAKIPKPQPRWGYLCVVGDTVLGSYDQTGGWGGESPAVFALSRSDGAIRWVHRARGIVPNVSIAVGDGKLFCLETPSGEQARRAKRRGESQKLKSYLVACDLARGAELWRREVSAKDLDSRQVRCAHGVVVVADRMAFDAEAGRLMWKKDLESKRPVVIRGDWILAEPHAYYLRTGEQRKTSHFFSGEQIPWAFVRAYGCGSVVGAQDMLFFRSGAAGLFDFRREGTTTFGGIRPGCSTNVIAANGLVLLPESSSACTCSYNYQTSVALVPSADRGDPWYVFQGRPSRQPAKQIRLNLGAPGDRWGAERVAWLSYPRPRMPGACPVSVEIHEKDRGKEKDKDKGEEKDRPLWYRRPPQGRKPDGTDRPWLYAFGLEGAEGITMELVPRTTVVSGACAKPPALDGKLDDDCWKQARAIPFARKAHLQQPRVTLLALRDGKHLYLGYRRETAMRRGKPAPLVARQKGQDVPCALDDSLEILLTDERTEAGLQLGVSCAGGRIDYRHPDAKARADIKWNGKWTCHVQKDKTEWSAEIAIPFSDLADAKIDPKTLLINVLSRNRAGDGPKTIWLAELDTKRPFLRERLLKVVEKPPAPPAGSYTVRLHFAELEDLKPAQRVFSVALQGKQVLKDFDIVQAAGAPGRAIVKEFKGIPPAESLKITFTPKIGRPTLAAVEVLLEK